MDPVLEKVPPPLQDDQVAETQAQALALWIKRRIRYANQAG